jgi:hypothetical protein
MDKKYDFSKRQLEQIELYVGIINYASSVLGAVGLELIGPINFKIKDCHSERFDSLKSAPEQF